MQLGSDRVESMAFTALSMVGGMHIQVVTGVLKVGGRESHHFNFPRLRPITRGCSTI